MNWKEVSFLHWTLEAGMYHGSISLGGGAYQWTVTRYNVTNHAGNSLKLADAQDDAEHAIEYLIEEAKPPRNPAKQRSIDRLEVIIGLIKNTRELFDILWNGAPHMDTLGLGRDLKYAQAEARKIHERWRNERDNNI